MLRNPHFCPPNSRVFVSTKVSIASGSFDSKVFAEDLGSECLRWHGWWVLHSFLNFSFKIMQIINKRPDSTLNWEWRTHLTFADTEELLCVDTSLNFLLFSREPSLLYPNARVFFSTKVSIASGPFDSKVFAED
ncbi:hypothetical protein CEXT_632061 [Caerostris extrusa]|uniref:Uncharacterized protein n=1 Tax=Caerostris extrusa TaxID=172846 RepID=A0AAV4WYP5_CAEEX|nr:hypothetical protein CEXT_632061 [Caerostris extrusa]